MHTYPLHSNLVLFKLSSKLFTSLIQTSLHSNLVLFKSNRPILTIYASTLYIPIWFYSNKIGDNLGNDMSSTFTFQSGSIQIVCLIETNLNLMSLHSNLVLFKLIRNACSSMSPPTFTFQSGSIQI